MYLFEFEYILIMYEVHSMILCDEYKFWQKGRDSPPPLSEANESCQN